MFSGHEGVQRVLGRRHPGAKQFYGETLGLEISEENGMLMLQLAGDRTMLVYPKPDHEPATFTILNFPVDDIEAAVDGSPSAASVRALRRARARDRREGHLPRRGPADRLVQGPGGQRPVGDPGLDGLALPPVSGGIVYLVGAGPGDPGLMTRRALELIARGRRDPLRPADPAGALDGARARRRAALRRQGAGRAGARAGGDQRAARRARPRRARRVVRLKGGDPFVFGRGGEEAEALAAAGVRVRGRARRDRRGRGAGLRRHPGDAPRRRLRGRLRHRPRGSRRSPRARSTGTRSRASRARSCSTWA